VSPTTTTVKILHYHLEFGLETGGVARAVIDLCSALAAADHEVTVLTADATDTPDRWRAGAPGSPSLIEIGPRPRTGRLLGRPALKAINRHLAEADVLHLHGLWAPYNDQIAAAARALGRPCILSPHGMLDDWCMAQRGLRKRVYLAAFGRKTLQAAAAVHCTAEAELAQARRWFPKGRGVVIPLIFDAASYQDLPGPGRARAEYPQLDTQLPLLLFLSRLHPKKGVEQLIHAAARLRRDDRDCVVVIAGSGDTGYEQRLQALVQRLRLEDRVRFLGFVSGAEKISLYEAADLFVLPTSQENFGFVLFEALAAATPVITTCGADTWTELEASGGALITKGDPEALATAAAALLDDPRRRRDMGRAGRAWVLNTLSGERIVQRYAQLYAEVAGA
jgi:glycosyltransferase involved in cell wall biosynthesis